MSLQFLRDDLPPPDSFTVSELPHTAKLDQNESPVDLPAALKRDIAAQLASRAWNRYPQPKQYVEAKRTFAAVVGLDPDALCFTVGCDQAIMAAFHLAGGPGRRARWFEPTYPYFALAASLTHTIGDRVLMGDRLDEGIQAAEVTADPSPHLMILVSPNNPSGVCPPAEAIDAALEGERRLVFVDEAYAEFAGETKVGLLGDRSNLLVGRSLSKATIADVRLGYCVGHPELIGAVETLFTAPYHLNALQLVIAARYADIAPHVRASVEQVVSEREQLQAALAGLAGVSPWPSRANFVLFQVAGPPERARAVYERLARDGVRVRDVGALPTLAGFLRVTVGTRAEDETFLSALRAALE